MLVGLPSKDIAKHWDIFKEIIRQAVPTAPDMLPDRMQRMLYAAMTGRIQCWLMYEDDGCDEFYGGMVTRVAVDDLSGQKSLLIYALTNFKQASREARKREFATLKRIAKEWGCAHISAYCPSRLVAETTLKANQGKGEIINYILIPTGD